MDQRTLRGGSSGRSSGSWSSGSWSGGSNNYNRNNNSSSNYNRNNNANNNYNRNNNNNNNNNRNNNKNNTGSNTRRNRGWGSTFAKVLGGVALGLVGLALLGALLPALGIGGACLGGGGLLAACCAGLAGAFCCSQAASKMNQGTTNSSNQMGYTNGGEGMSSEFQDGQFEDIARNAKLQVESQSSPDTSGGMMAQPYSGQYSTSYMDKIGTHNATLNLHFMNNGNGFKISGQGHDIDGSTIIEDGHANYDGSAWWRERSTTGEVGLQVVSRGTFYFQQGSFQGTWHANTMEVGTYISFMVMQQQPDLPQIPPAYNSNIPVVNAQAVGSAPNVPVVQSYDPNGYVPPLVVQGYAPAQK